jgi:hypothetical protein
VSVGDADGDGLDDLYVAQPAGLPNRLYRARADGTFEDVTERAGLAVLDDTSQSLFADVDNDGDQDLVLTRARAALFENDGGPVHLHPAPSSPGGAPGRAHVIAGRLRPGRIPRPVSALLGYYGPARTRRGRPRLTTTP